jgi:hypothetical protein
MVFGCHARTLGVCSSLVVGQKSVDVNVGGRLDDSNPNQSNLVYFTCFLLAWHSSLMQDLMGSLLEHREWWLLKQLSKNRCRANNACSEFLLGASTSFAASVFDYK